jgi:hypothetical protein
VIETINEMAPTFWILTEIRTKVDNSFGEKGKEYGKNVRQKS